MDISGFNTTAARVDLEKFSVFFRVSDVLDPEERLEDACLWKAMHDEYGDDILGLPNKDNKPSHGVTFGRGMWSESRQKLKYWEDPSFLENTGRRFTVCGYDDIAREVENLHRDGMGAFLKSTRSKHFLGVVPVGTDWNDVIGEMAYSFMDGEPQVMVQELLPMNYEHRFIAINRTIVAHSPIAWHLTPIDKPHPFEEYETPRSPTGTTQKVHHEGMLSLAQRVAERMISPHACVDTAIGPNGPVVVEFNPMHLGNLGLYACDVRALARASRELLLNNYSRMKG